MGQGFSFFKSKEPRNPTQQRRRSNNRRSSVGQGQPHVTVPHQGTYSMEDQNDHINPSTQPSRSNNRRTSVNDSPVSTSISGYKQYQCDYLNVTFNIPNAVTRSTTADIVNKGFTDKNQQRDNFLILRTKAMSLRQAWIQAHEEFWFVFGQINPGPDLAKNEVRLKEARNEYRNALLEMAKNGIWNCGEFADFACITISESQEVSGQFGYIPQVADLNDPEVPDERGQYYAYFKNLDSKQIELLKEENHDHAFVVVYDKEKHPLYVVDFWQSLIDGVKKLFMGKFDKFINFLNTNIDGHYVKREVFAKHIRVVNIYKASGEAEQNSSYSKVI